MISTILKILFNKIYPFISIQYEVAIIRYQTSPRILSRICRVIITWKIIFRLIMALKPQALR